MPSNRRQIDDIDVQLLAELEEDARLSNAELGFRLRYEIRREFAPYVGVSWERRFRRTASFARAAGESPDATAFVVGLSGWF